MTTDSEGPRRYLLATAVAHYPKAPKWDRPGLNDAREQIIRLFTEDLGYQHVSTLGLDPHKDQLTTLLRNFCRDDARQPDDIVAVYIGAHGEVDDDTHEHLLLTADTDPADVADALPTAELARKMLHKTAVRRVLLMLDTCYSGHGGAELTAAAITTMTHSWGDDHGTGLAVITSAQPAEQAETGTFPRLLHDAVLALPTAGYNPATLPLDSIVKAMNTSAGKPGYQTIGHSVTGLTGEVPPFLPNPRYDPRMTEVDLAIQHASEFEVQAERRDTELRTRLLVRAMGGHAAHSTQGWWFSGRHTALADINAWLRYPDPARPLKVVTGNPGSGKTAVLGIVAALTHPERRATVPLDTLGLPAAAVPDPATVDVAIYAQSLTTNQVLAGIAAAVHSHASTPGQLLGNLTGRDQPLTVLIDALDEAGDPDHLIRSLLRPLIEHAAGRLRLLVGTRDFLLERLGGDREDAVDLDADRYADLQALTTYAARGLLEAGPDSPYVHESPQLIRAVADGVAAAADPSFLVARITSATLAAQAQAADPSDSAWRRSLPRYPGEAMRRDLETRLGGNATKVRDLLRPLAFAEGQGLPWEDIWAAIASRAAGTGYTDEDLLWLRKHAGSYVVEATEDGRSTYRLYHQALADHLRDGVDATAMHTAIAEVLVSRAPRMLDGHRDWTRAHPYTLRHLATHAAFAGQLDALIVDTGYLVHAEPDALLLALHQVSTEDGALTCAVYRCSAARHRQLPPPRRRQILATDAARFSASRLHHELAAPLLWPPRWATGQQTTNALRATISGHTGLVTAVASGHLDDRPVAITGSTDGTARVWDIATGKLITTFNGHTNAVEAVCYGKLNGRPVAITGSEDQTARVWDIATSEQMTTFTGHADTVYAVASGEIDGLPVAITGGGPDGRLQVWDLATGKQITSFARHTDTVYGVASGWLGDGPVAVTSSDDGTVRVWNLATGKQIITLARHTGTVTAVAYARLDDQPVTITGGADGTVRVWNLATGKQITTLTGHTGTVTAVAYARLDDQPVTITGSTDGTVRVWNLTMAVTEFPSHGGHSADIRAVACGELHDRQVAITCSEDQTTKVWDLATGEQVQTLTGHTDMVTAVVCGQLNNRPVAITGSEDRTAQVWDLASGERVNTLPLRTRHAKAVTSVAYGLLDGRPVAITGSSDKAARVWDLTAGKVITAFTGHTGTVTAVAYGLLDDRPVAITGSSDKTVRVWDLATGKQVISLPRHTRHVNAVTAVAYGLLDDRPVAITGSSDKTVRVWDLATGKQVQTLIGHTDIVTAVACGVLDNRAVVITGGKDQTVRMWDLATGSEGAIFDYQGLAWNTVLIGPAGELIIAAGWDITVLVRKQ